MTRAHSADLKPWYFENQRQGRFSLEGARGTCYAADDEETAMRERLGGMFCNANRVSLDDARRSAVSVISVPEPQRIANISDKGAAARGVTRELPAGASYELAQGWADRFDELCFGGVRYSSRFTTEPGPNSWAIFGEGGTSPEWPVLGTRSGEAVCRDLGFEIRYAGQLPGDHEVTMERRLPSKARKHPERDDVARS